MDVDEVLRKYSRKIERDIGSERRSVAVGEVSRDYESFKKDMLPELSRYERWVGSLGSFITVKLGSKDENRIQKQLDGAHLNVLPGEVIGLAIFSFIGVFLLGIMLSFATWFFTGSFPLLFLLLMLAVSFFLFYYYYTMPSRLEVSWRLKASSQMVPAILYMVVYMKHTSNLERALSFASQHVEQPLALDLKRVLWNVQTGRFSTVKESLDDYLEFWRLTNIEFVESFHLLESSLFEPNEARRLQILERSLQVILDGVYDRMLRYTHTIKSPLTNLYMLGIVLPTLALALLPLVSTLLGGVITSVHVFVLFNLLIPFFVFYMTMQILLKRPGGYGESGLVERNPLYYKYVSRRPYIIAGLICFPFLLIGLLPLIFGYTAVPEWLGIANDFALSDIGLGIFGDGNFFGFYEGKDGRAGPFGVGALLLSLLVPFSIALFFSISFKMKTKELIKSRKDTKELEKEFTSSLFTLGNRLGDGVPAEIAFAKVAESSKGQKTENFFKIVHTNIQTMGMSLDQALFNPRRGALVYFPSSLISTSMHVLVEGVKKGLKVAAQSLMSISEYVKNIQKINDRLNDLLASVISDMQSNMTFLAPLLAGIVIGLASMITSILTRLKSLTELGGDASIGGFSTIGNITQLFDVFNMIPPYFMQIAIGLYIVQIVFILTSTLVIVDSGEDKLRKTHDVGKNLMRASILYLITALIAIIALSVLSGVALSGLGG